MGAGPRTNIVAVEWPELLQVLFQCTQSPDVLMQEVVWRVLAALPTIFGSHQERYLGTLHDLMLTAITSGILKVGRPSARTGACRPLAGPSAVANGAPGGRGRGMGGIGW